MAHTNSTTNYHLPQFISSDKPAWLTDVNTAYSDIDIGMKNAQSAADSAQNDATQALTDSATAISTATQADAKASGAIASMAAMFSTTNTYSEGDYVIYNNILYKCIVAVTVPGPWSGTLNWERATIDTVVNDLKDDMNNLTAADIDYNANTTVADKINEISDAISATTTGTLTASSGVTLTQGSIKRYGNIVTLGFRARISSPSRWATILSFDDSFSVTGDYTAFSILNTTSTSGVQTAHANVYGNRVRLGNLLPDANEEYSGTVTWCIG